MCALASSAPAAAAELTRLPEPQTRGYIINLRRGLSRHGLELEVRRVAEAGFNVLLFPGLSNGWTLYPSQAMRPAGLPGINPAFRRWNPLAAISELAREAGLTLWAYARPYEFLPSHSVTEHRLLRKHPEWRVRAHPRMQSAATRRHEQRHACPLNPEYRRFVADLLVELVMAYPVEGLVLHFEGLGLSGGRLAGSPFCFCASCRKLYHETFNAELLADALTEKIARVHAWQLHQVHEHYLYLRHRLIRARRTLRIVCRARPTWRDRADAPRPPEAGTPLIDWPALLAMGAIDELAVDPDGESCDEALGSRLAADYAHLGDRSLFLPVVSVPNPAALRGPIEASERFPVPGFLAEFQHDITDEDARMIRDQLLPALAPVPESEPIRSAAYLLSRIRLMNEDRPVVHDLLYDVLRLLARQLPFPNDFNTLQVIEQNLHGFEQAIRRGRLGAARIPERTMRDLGLARRYVRLACMDVRS